MFLFLRPLRLLIRALLAESTPRQMAWGFGLGMLIGLIPKGNLLAICVGILVASLQVNLGVVAMSAVVFTLCSPSIDPVCDRIGCFFLSHPALQEFWTQLANLPVVPWTNFQNSVVTGSLITGLLLLWPVQRISLPLFERYAEFIAEHGRRWRLARVLLGAEWADRLGSVE